MATTKLARFDAFLLALLRNQQSQEIEGDDFLLGPNNLLCSYLFSELQYILPRDVVF